MQETVQVLGALVTIVGLVIVAPYEVGRVLPALWHSITQALGRARGWLVRVLRLRKPQTFNVGSMTAALSGGSVSVTGRVGVTDQGTTKQQLTAIRAALVSIYGELDALRAEDGAIRAEMTAKVNQLAEDHAATRRTLEEQQRVQGQLNARGVPLAAIGALLTGLPGAWVTAGGWWFGGPLLAIGGVAAAVAARWLCDARHKLAEGWHDLD